MCHHDPFGYSRRSAAVGQKRQIISSINDRRRRKTGAVVGQKRRQRNDIGGRFMVADDDEVLKTCIRILASRLEGGLGCWQ